jgi:hypothetical protein
MPEVRIHKHAHKECLASAPETSKSADMDKGDIPITQIDGEGKVVVKTDSNQIYQIILVH